MCSTFTTHIMYTITTCYKEERNITTLIVYLIVRRKSYNKDSPPTITTQSSPIYDVKLPETSKHKEIIELQENTAYGYIN